MLRRVLLRPPAPFSRSALASLLPPARRLSSTEFRNAFRDAATSYLAKRIERAVSASELLELHATASASFDAPALAAAWARLESLLAPLGEDQHAVFAAKHHGSVGALRADLLAALDAARLPPSSFSLLVAASARMPSAHGRLVLRRASFLAPRITRELASEPGCYATVCEAFALADGPGAAATLEAMATALVAPLEGLRGGGAERAQGEEGGQGGGVQVVGRRRGRVDELPSLLRLPPATELLATLDACARVGARPRPLLRAAAHAALAASPSTLNAREAARLACAFAADADATCSRATRELGRRAAAAAFELSPPELAALTGALAHVRAPFAVPFRQLAEEAAKRGGEQFQLAQLVTLYWGLGREGALSLPLIASTLPSATKRAGELSLPQLAQLLWALTRAPLAPASPAGRSPGLLDSSPGLFADGARASAAAAAGGSEHGGEHGGGGGGSSEQGRFNSQSGFDLQADAAADGYEDSELRRNGGNAHGGSSQAEVAVTSRGNFSAQGTSTHGGFNWQTEAADFVTFADAARPPPGTAEFAMAVCAHLPPSALLAARVEDGSRRALLLLAWSLVTLGQLQPELWARLLPPLNALDPLSSPFSSPTSLSSSSSSSSRSEGTHSGDSHSQRGQSARTVRADSQEQTVKSRQAPSLGETQWWQLAQIGAALRLEMHAPHPLHSPGLVDSSPGLLHSPGLVDSSPGLLDFPGSESGRSAVAAEAAPPAFPAAPGAAGEATGGGGVPPLSSATAAAAIGAAHGGRGRGAGAGGRGAAGEPDPTAPLRSPPGPLFPSLPPEPFMLCPALSAAALTAVAAAPAPSPSALHRDVCAALQRLNIEHIVEALIPELGYRVDIVLTQARVAIEVAGSFHSEPPDAPPPPLSKQVLPSSSSSPSPPSSSSSSSLFRIAAAGVPLAAGQSAQPAQPPLSKGSTAWLASSAAESGWKPPLFKAQPQPPPLKESKTPSWGGEVTEGEGGGNYAAENFLYASDGGGRYGAERARRSWRPRSLAMKRRHLRALGYHVATLKSSEWPTGGSLGAKERAVVRCLLGVLAEAQPPTRRGPTSLPVALPQPPRDSTPEPGRGGAASGRRGGGAEY